MKAIFYGTGFTAKAIKNEAAKRLGFEPEATITQEDGENTTFEVTVTKPGGLTETEAAAIRRIAEDWRVGAWIE